ncbi:MAG: NmrA family NAD(P)-binding protein, partial [Xanthomonadales bacterium]|nr:NmrA family NAD(P)-binding protein [Xanthomonadales bacterium]
MQRWLMSLWRLVGWPLFGATVSTAAVLGYVGFRLYFETQPVRKAPSDLAYLSLQLFVLESGSVPETGAPWQLEVARLLAPATTGVAIAVALAAVFRGEWEELRLRRRKRHVVVCGLGERGARLVGALLEAGYRVVAIERDPTAPAIAEVRRRGALVVVGDARTSQVLCRARVERARYVVALTGTDDVNAELAIRAGELALDRGPALTCLAHVKDPELCALLRSEELAAGHSDYRLDFFNIYEQAARALLRDHPPFGVSEDEPCLLLIGFDRLGQAVVVEAARQWRAHPEARERPLAITVLDPVAAPIGDLLRTRFPQLEHVARLRVMTAEFDPLDCSAVESGPWDAVYVCVDDDSTALEAALQA